MFAVSRESFINKPRGRLGLSITGYACCKSLLKFTVEMVFTLPAVKDKTESQKYPNRCEQMITFVLPGRCIICS